MVLWNLLQLINTMHTSRQNNSGFTLLEVMVALTIIALGMAAVIKTVASTTVNSAYLRDKTFAYWVAQNQMAELELTAAKPKIGFSDGNEKLAGVTWYWTRKIDGTEDPDTKRVEISVRMDKDKDAQNYAALTSLLHVPN